jgi:phosphoglycolate phosphatase
MAEPRLIVFDMDGTLVDTGAVIARHMATTFIEHGLPAPTPEQSNSVIGLSLEIALGQLAACDAAMARQLAQSYRKHYRAMLEGGGQHEPLYAGAIEAVTRLATDETSILGIATGKSLHGARRVLELHSIIDHFVTIQTPDHNPSKPHPGMMFRACEETGIEPSRAVMIGDTTFDMELGVAAGAKTIGVTWGYHERVRLEQAGADLIIDDYADLDVAIEKVLS